MNPVILFVQDKDVSELIAWKSFVFLQMDDLKSENTMLRYVGFFNSFKYVVFFNSFKFILLHYLLYQYVWE